MLKLKKRPVLVTRVNKLKKGARMEFQLLQEAHFDACTASHEGEYKRWLDVNDVQYVQRDKGMGFCGGIVSWVSIALLILW